MPHVLSIMMIFEKETAIHNFWNGSKQKWEKCWFYSPPSPLENNDTLQQYLVDLSRESEAKQEQITEQKKALADTDKQKALDILDVSHHLRKDHKEVSVTFFHF